MNESASVTSVRPGQSSDKNEICDRKNAEMIGASTGAAYHTRRDQLRRTSRWPHWAHKQQIAVDRSVPPCDCPEVRPGDALEMFTRNDVWRMLDRIQSSSTSRTQPQRSWRRIQALRSDATVGVAMWIENRRSERPFAL